MFTLFNTIVFTVALSAVNVAAAPQNLIFAKSACGDICLTAALTNGAPVVVAPCNSANVTQVTWSFETSGATSPIRLTSGGTTKCLDVKDGKNQNGVKLQVWSCGSGNKNQQFKVDVEGTDAVIEWAAHSDKCLDLTDGRETTGNQVQLWKCSDTNDNQVWDLSA